MSRLPLSAVLFVALAMPGTALAKKDKREKEPAADEVSGDSSHETNAETGPPEAQAEGSKAPEGDNRRKRRFLVFKAPGTVPAEVPPEGSLWDFIEKSEGAIPTGAAIEQSEELEAERTEERAFLEGSATDEAAVGFYTDPAATLGAAEPELTPDPDDPYFLKLVDPDEFDIPVVVNDDVERWVAYFTGRGRKYYAKWLARSTRVRPMMIPRLEAAGAPKDLVYLSMIESGYNTHAYSSAAAVGLWQFISSTGRLYDLRVDWWVDERRDPYKATDAAIHFLTDLEKQFGHWYLAWAGYNGGPGRVRRAIRNHGTKDFWTLVEKNGFPAETDNYVPKIIAAAIIGKHPERYGFTGIEFQEPLDLEPVAVGANISLDVLARSAGLTNEELQHHNPHLRRWATPPSPDKTVIYLPTGSSGAFLAALDKVPPEERLTFRRHRVQKGETLGKIASTYGVTVLEIQEINRIGNANRIYVGMELVVPVNGASATPPEALASIAGSAPKASSTPRAKHVTHVVQRGQSLSAIASRYGVSTSDLMRWNRISNPDKIYVGQKLTLVEPETRWTSHTVRRGDTLTAIARKHGCSVAELKGWNSIKGEKIYVGQRLKIRKS